MRSSSLYDRADSFGWISIALHWSTAAAVCVLWFVGESISRLPLDEMDARRDLHITLGLACWIPLVGRIVWRIIVRHPRASDQSLLTHRIARFAHFTMLFGLSAMLISGPLMAWAMPERIELFDKVFYFHALSAKLIFALVVLHILGTLKHLMFHEDDTLARMIWPRPNKTTSNRQQDP